MWHQEADGTGAGHAASNAAPSPSQNFGLALATGLRLTALRKPDPDRATGTPASFWLATAVTVPCYAALDYFTTDPPRKFSADGFESLAARCLLSLFVCHLLLRAARREASLWSFATLFTYGALLPTTLYAVIWTVLPEGDGSGSIQQWIAYVVLAMWWAAMFWRLLSGFGADGPEAKRVLLSVLAAALLAGCNWLMPSGDFFQTDYDKLYSDRPREEPLLAEDVLPSQPELLAKALDRIVPGTQGKPSLYFVSFAPYATQGVFAREARYTAHLFERDFGAQDRTLTLINSRASVSTTPLASVSNLRTALQQLGRKMIPDQDILFLYLTSHGSRDAELSVDLPGVGLHALGASDLAGMLDAADIRWRVIVVSSCYSGSFIPALQNDHTLVITAARADRTSFGCDDKADFTYFGRAYFQQALTRTRSFVDAFGIARDLINRWETEQSIQHAEPQIDRGSLIQAKLDRWQATLPPRAPAAEPPVPAVPAVADGKGAQQAGLRRDYIRLHRASMVLLLIILLVTFSAQLRAYLRHRERSLFLLTLSSAVGLATLPLQLLASGTSADPDRYMRIIYALFGLDAIQWLSATVGILALLSSYGRLAERARQQEDRSNLRRSDQSN